MDKIEICGQQFDKDLEYFTFNWPSPEIENMKELRKLKQFSNLNGAGFGSTNLNDEGLRWVCENIHIENLDLQDTHVSSEGLRALAGLPALKILRLKQNPQIDNDAVKHLNALISLRDLQIHETSITHDGLAHLTLNDLEDLLVVIRNENFSFDFLQKLSARLPNCTILAKGSAKFTQGKAKVFEPLI